MVYNQVVVLKMMLCPAVLMAALVGAADAAPSPVARRRTEVVDTAPDGSPANSPTQNPFSLSGNGHVVVFSSEASNLVPGEIGRFAQVYARAGRGPMHLVSRSLDGVRGGNGDSSAVVCDRRGRRIAFFSEATNLVDADLNGRADVFVHDVIRATTTLVSVDVTGYDSWSPRISEDGRRVAFLTDVHERETPFIVRPDFADANVYVRDLEAATTLLVSVDGTGAAVGGCGGVVLSSRGGAVAFDSGAAGLVGADLGGRRNVFARNLASAKTVLVSVAADGGAADGDSWGASISANGRFIAFTSDATNLVDNDHNGRSDVFLRDVARGTTRLVSVDVTGTRSGDGDSSRPTISDDGRVISFDSTAGDLVENDSNKAIDAFVRDVRRGVTTWLGSSAAVPSIGNGTSFGASLSRDGRTAVFLSDNIDLVPGTAPPTSVFLRRLHPAKVVLISVDMPRFSDVFGPVAAGTTAAFGAYAYPGGSVLVSRAR